ncbi:uncharacterized protein ppp1r3aa [Mugil cephalus]|uniref:uncharacterized protein ppp1r3aa n=1 Tax=Mugil cephalus TaxID=48193 RepID=UPI001FB6F827|nr:uncharacterized protein ppp1r3aa [Mugil cephalus]
MEALHVRPLVVDGAAVDEEELGKGVERDEGGAEALSPSGSTTDEEANEDSEPEPPPVVRRKVSFADAFGLNLVSVKEFDNVEVTEPEHIRVDEREVTHSLEEYYMSCLFTVPSSPEELDHRVKTQMLELESIELLPGTTTLRGIVRVANLCYSKHVYARVTLDRWNSFFDLQAEYVPGSSDWKTDRFTFKYTLVPPFERDGTRVEFCLCYETSSGTFWANNQSMNYVLFCHQKGLMKEYGPQTPDENTGYKSKRSCLKANRNGSAEERTRETVSTATVASEATHKAERAERKTMDKPDVQSLINYEVRKPRVESIKSRHRATRLARVQDYFSQRRQQAPKAFAHDSADGQKVSQPMPAAWGPDSASVLFKGQKTQPDEAPKVLTYHEIPLLTLDWNNDRPQQCGAADADDIWTGRDKITLSHALQENAPSVNNMWDAFLNGAGDTNIKESSVWQAFQNGPSHGDHSGVPESEWLQSAASVSPSNDKELQTQYASSQEFGGFRVGAGAPAAVQAHTLAARQALSGTCETQLPNAALNTEDHERAEVCVSSPRDDNIETRDAPQRSQTNSVTDTPQEFSLKGAPPVSEDSADSSTECHRHAVREQEREGIIEVAEGIVGDEPFTWRTADLVTSSGESETTDMTAMPESQNASAGDRISQGARLAEGLSSSGEGEVTGTAHNAIDDMLAFRETIRQGTKDEARNAFSTSRAEGGITTHYAENKVSTEEEVFRPQETEECEISPRYADEIQREKAGLRQNSENPLQDGDESETRPAQSHADGADPKQTREEHFERNKIMATELNKDASSNKDTEVLDGHSWQHDDKQLNSSLPAGSTSAVLEVHDEQARPVQAGDEQCDEKREHSAPRQAEESMAMTSEIGEEEVLNETKEEISWSTDGISEEQHKVKPSTDTRPTVESKEVKMVFQSDYDTLRFCPTDKYNPNSLEIVEPRWIHSQTDMKGQKEAIGSETIPEEVRAKESVAKEDTSTERQPETSERIGEDMCQEDEDERVSIGELEIEAMRELMGNVESPWGERENTAAELKEQELSAEAESSPRVEYKKLSDRTKDPITPETTESLDVIESGLEKALIERFGENLVCRVWKEVFSQEEQASNIRTNIVDGMGYGSTDTTQDCHLLFDDHSNDTFDSGVFSLTELPTDPDISLEQTLATKGNEHSPKERSQSLTMLEQTQVLSELQTDLNSSAHLSQDLATQCRQSPTESAQTLSSPKDQEDYSLIKERSVTHQETGRQIEDCAAPHKESFNQSAHPSHKHLCPSSEKLKESDSLVWWSILHILSHIIRLVTCALLVGGLFVIVFLYDFPTIFSLYIFSLCWWFYKWNRHRATTKKGMVS